MQDTIAITVTISRFVKGKTVKTKFRNVAKITTEFGCIIEIGDTVYDLVYTDWGHVPAESISGISWNYA